MALNVISNFAANIAQRNLKASDQQATNSLNKLSSGSRVVSAKDDAASMAIGSALKAEVMAMEQATVNARQAGSLLQIADGAMANVGEILVRGKMLAVQASSGQFSSTERQMFDNEYQSLLAEIDRIAITTKFAGNLLVNGSVEVAQKANGLNFVNDQSGGYKNFLSKQNGFEGISFEEDVPSSVFRFAYNQSTRALTVRNLDTGTSQTVVLANRSIVEGQFETVKFSQLGLTVSLNNLFNKGQMGFPLADGFSSEHKIGDIYDHQNLYIPPSTDITPIERSLGVTQSAVESDGINLTKVGAAFGRLPRVMKMSSVGNIFYMYGTKERDFKTIGIGASLTNAKLAKIEVTQPHLLTATSAAKLKVEVSNTAQNITVTDVTDPASPITQTVATTGAGAKVITFDKFGLTITTATDFASGTSNSGGAQFVSSLVTGSALTNTDLANTLAITSPTYRSVAEVETALSKQQAVTPPAIYGILQREGNVYTVELRDMTISSEADRNLVCTLRLTTNNEAKADTDYGSVYLSTLSQLVGANSTTVSETKRFNFKLGTAARDTDVLSFNVDGITTEALKLKGSGVINESVAKAASAKVTDAILKLSTVRANVGASQNRLEFASTNLATSIENTEAARSDLLDLDVAREMTTFTSKQILMQAGVAMLAQANQMPQNLLRLFPNAG